MDPDNTWRIVDSVGEGELVIAYPGTNVFLPYSGGNVMIREDGYAVYTSLNITDIKAHTHTTHESQEAQEAQQIVQILESGGYELVKQELAEPSSYVYLFYSEASDGTQLLTLPHIGYKSDHFLRETSLKEYVCSFASAALPHGLIELEAYHTSECMHSILMSEHTLARDQDYLIAKARELPTIANEVYRKLIDRL